MFGRLLRGWGGVGCLQSDVFDAETTTMVSLLAVRPGEADLPARLQELCVLPHLAGGGNRLLQGKCNYLQVVCALIGAVARDAELVFT